MHDHLEGFGLLLGLHLLLAPPHLVIVIDVATLTLAFGVVLTVASVRAGRRKRTPSILVVAVIAHAHRVEGPVDVLARRHRAFLSTTLVLLALEIFLTQVHQHHALCAGVCCVQVLCAGGLR